MTWTATIKHKKQKKKSWKKIDKLLSMDIPEYHEFLPEKVLDRQLDIAVPVLEVGDAVLRVVPWSSEELERCGLEPSSGASTRRLTLESVETEENLRFVIQLYLRCRERLGTVLERRRTDREFIDQMILDLSHKQSQLDALLLAQLAEQTNEIQLGPIGQTEESGRVPIGPLQPSYYEPRGRPVAAIPDYLQGPHVTLFGPPESASLAINAMNALLRRLPDEPAIVEQLLSDPTMKSPRPFWGADDEDSRTPLRGPLLVSEQNLCGCFDGTLTAENGQRRMQLESRDRLSLPIKRFPGLALPMMTHFVNGSPLPLHLYDFALHVFLHRHQPEALTFYVPKLENEEEAAYLHHMIATAEDLLGIAHGTVRIMVVLENPRAVFRLNEIMDALDPYFVGASLGWHDYLASTARLFKNDPSYHIPVKSDPNIVIKHIKEAHLILAKVVGGRGGIAIGGMYGVLPDGRDWRSSSFQVVLAGYIRDVIAQLRRGLNGFWVAHPDFVRIGVALVQAYSHLATRADAKPLDTLIEQLILDAADRTALLDFVRTGDTAQGLDRRAASYPKSLLAAELQVSNVLPNNHPDEVRYNVFQALQYLADWLAGNGCVALPAIVCGERVRVMDDLATTERSRWEVWAEVAHGRFPLHDFLRIVHEELHFIRTNARTDTKQVRVQWTPHTAKWYPVAAQIFIALVCPANDRPVEFVTELLMTFTTEDVRAAANPWDEAHRLAPTVFRQRKDVALFNFWFAALPSKQFATVMSCTPIYDDLDRACSLIHQELTDDDLIDTLSYFPLVSSSSSSSNNKNKNDSNANEIWCVSPVDQGLSEPHRALAGRYVERFGLSLLLVTTTGERLTDGQLTLEIERALLRSRQEELARLRTALCAHVVHVFNEQAAENGHNGLVFGKAYVPFHSDVEELLSKWHVPGVSVTVFNKHASQSFGIGLAKVVDNRQLSRDGGSWFQMQSLSKTVAAAFTFEYFRARSLSVDTPVNELLGNPALCRKPSSWRLLSKPGCPAEWADRVTVRHLMSHSALGLHYCPGVSPLRRPEGLPPILELISGQHQAETGYPNIYVEREPGISFAYSGGGFMVLEHLLMSMSGHDSVEALTRSFLNGCGLDEFTFDPLPGFVDPALMAAGHLEPDADSSDVEDVRYKLGPLPARASRSQRFRSFRFISSDYADALMFPAFSAGGMGTTRSLARFLQHLNRAYQRVEGSGSISHDTAVQMFGTANARLLNTSAFMGEGSAMGNGAFVLRAGPNRFALHQAAGDGYRGLYISCFRGPDAGSGLVIACNGNNYGVLLISAVALSALRYLNWSGRLSPDAIAASTSSASFSFKGLAQEQIVNLGYRQLLFSTFVPARGELLPPGPLDPLAEVNLACSATITHVSSDEFAPASNLISPHLPVFDPRAFGAIGKVMDSWETARHNPLPADVVELRLSAPSPIAYVSICTMFHDGNHADQTRVEAFSDEAKADSFDLVPLAKLQGHSIHRFVVPAASAQRPVLFVRVYNYPDGGITRLGLFAPATLPPAAESLFSSAGSTRARYAHPIPPVIKRRLPKPSTSSTVALHERLRSYVRPGAEYDVASSVFGGAVLRVSNQHYGPADAIVSPFRPSGMFDGFETARSRVRDSAESVEIAFAHPASIKRIRIDFTYFVANNPDSMAIEALQSDGTSFSLMPQTWTKPYAGNVFEYSVASSLAGVRIAKVRVLCLPCGGFNRISFFTVSHPRAAL